MAKIRLCNLQQKLDKMNFTQTLNDVENELSNYREHFNELSDFNGDGRKDLLDSCQMLCRRCNATKESL